MRNDCYEDVPRTLAVVTGLWTLLVVEGTRAGVFSRVPTEAFAGLAIFAVVFAVSAVTVDLRVRGWFEHRGPLGVRLAQFALAATILATGTVLATARQAQVGVFPWAPIVLVGIPITVALAVVAARTTLGARTGALTAPAPLAPLLSRR